MAHHESRWPIEDPGSIRRTHREQVLLAATHDLQPVDVLILKAFANGCNGHETADMLGITYDSVHDHMSTMLPKLRAKTMAHAVGNAFRTGIIS